MKKNPKHIIETPWDSKVFGINTFEIKTPSKEAMEEAAKLRGHFTIKIDPHFSKKFLRDYGFYYCDTLIEPYCTSETFVYSEHKKASISRDISIDALVNISHGAFCGRFHRDFNIDKKLADLRYDTWLKELYNAGGVYGLLFSDKLIGFFSFSENKIHLGALDKKYCGKGLAKCTWGLACKELFKGHKKITSSVSAYNVSIINLFISLGFRFRNPIDVYHKLVK